MSFIGVYARPDSADALRVVREVYSVLEELGANPRVDVSLKPYLGDGRLRFFDLRFEVPEKAVVIGGDGTLLRFLCTVGDRPSPHIHPIKVGRRGYFFELDVYQGVERLRDFVEGSYIVERLDRVSVTVHRGAALLTGKAALNEAAIVAPGSKTVILRVEVDGEPVYENIEGDGVIIASPAGSTAYSLSAGGPVLDRRLKAMVVTPLNPTTMARPVVVEGGSRVVVTVLRASRSPTLFIDGQTFIRLRRGDRVEATLSKHPALLARYRRVRRIAIPW